MYIYIYINTCVCSALHNKIHAKCLCRTPPTIMAEISPNRYGKELYTPKPETYTCTHTHTHTHTHTATHTHTRARTHTHTHIYFYIHTHLFIYYLFRFIYYVSSYMPKDL